MKSRAYLGLLGVLLFTGCAAPRVTEPLSAPKVSEAPPPPAAMAPTSGMEFGSNRSSDEKAEAASSVDLEAARAMLAAGEREVGALLAQADEEPTAVQAEEKGDGMAKNDRARKVGESSKPSTARVARGPADAAEATPPTAAPASPPGVSRGPRCFVACKAMTSMRRAADRMCELVGSSDEQCFDARGRVARSQSQVERVCPACADAR